MKKSDLSARAPHAGLSSLGALVSRRGFVGALMGAGITLEASPAGGAFLFTALGQSLIKHDICSLRYPGRGEVSSILDQADACFSNLEVAIAGPGAGEETNSGLYSATAPVEVLDCLRSMSIDLLSLSNNHSFDLGAGGILATIRAVQDRKFGYAGTGADLAAAAAPGYLQTPKRRVALVAFASKVRDASIARDRPGVNHLRVSPDGVPDEKDKTRVLSAIEAASKQAQFVCVYQHDHYWHEDWQVTHQWKHKLTKECIDAGGSIFVSHGVPLMHGIEIYRRRPIFYGLGNFIFHTRTPVGHYESKVWESAIAQCTFQGNELAKVHLTPIRLNEQPTDPDAFYTRGLPTVVRGEQALSILTRLGALSRQHGTTLRLTGESGVIEV